MKPSSPKPKIFFITGVQRSGTTMLSVMLSKHSEIYLDGFSVAFRLTTCFDNYLRVLPDNLPHSKEAILTWLIQNDYKGRLAGLLDLDNLDQYPDIRSFIQHSIQKKLNKEKRTIWGDKSPNLQYFIPSILRLIPDAQFIHIVRDGRAAAYSAAQRANKNIFLTAQEWVDGNLVAIVNQDLIGADQFHILHFEKLLQEPEKNLKAVCRFLNIPFESEMLDLSLDLAPEEEGTAYVKNKIDASKIKTYANHLSAKTIYKIERIQGPLLRKLGYPLLETDDATRFRYLSVRKKIWLNTKNNFLGLFRSTRTGMHNRKKIKTKVPFKKRLHIFLFHLTHDLFSKPIFEFLFRRSFTKDKYLKK